MNYQYKTVFCSYGELEMTLNQYGKKGWRLSTLDSDEGHCYITLEREG